jgi:diacylglycerol kinase
MTRVSLVKSFRCAIKGVFRGIARERNLRIQTVIGAIIILISVLLRISKAYFITIILVIFLVLILELFNKNFERLIDAVSPEYSKEFGEIKDTMAGIVLCAALLSLIVGFLILYEPTMRFLKESPGSAISLILITANIAIMVMIFLYKKKNNNSNQLNNFYSKELLYPL